MRPRRGSRRGPRRQLGSRSQLQVLLTSLGLLGALGSLAAARAAGPGSMSLGADPSAGEIEGALRAHLGARFQQAFVAVRGVVDGQVDAVVTVIPTEDDTRRYDQSEANRLAEELRESVLRGGGGQLDFRTGSQFVILGPERLQVEGAGEELTRVVERIAMDVIREVTQRGLGLQYLSAAGYAGPQLALEVQARGIDLGPQERERQRELLQRTIEEQVLAARYGWIAYLPEQSYVEVWDAERPGDAIQWIEPAPGPSAAPAAVAPVAAPPAAANPVRREQPRDSIPLASWTEPARGGEALQPRNPDVPTPDLGVSLAPVLASRVPQASVPRRSVDPAPWLGQGEGTPPAQVEASWIPEPPGREVAPGGPSVQPFMGSTPEGLVPPSRASLEPAPRREIEPGALARRLRELRARSPWIPPAPGLAEDADTRAREPAEREPPRAYPAAPFAVGPGVASCELFVRFDTDESFVKPEEREQLRGFLQEVPPERVRGVVIVGYADSRNTDAYNLALGKRRAEAVRRFLVEEGIKEVRVEIKSFGEADPLLPNDTDHGRSVNRRAVLQVHFADPDRPMHADRSPFWRKGRSLPAPPRHDSQGLRKPYDEHWPQRWTPKWSGDPGE